VKSILNKLKIVGKDGSGLYLLDRELGEIAAAADAGEESAN